MSGHSKWASIKRKKGEIDAKRGKIFTKLIKEITVAARIGGGDINGNPRLRLAVDNAKASSMPKDNIDRAIKKGTGELESVSYEEIMYEGYGPGGVALLVEILTDNKNRVVSEIRHAFSKYGGSMGASGSVAWMFKKRGVITVSKKQIREDDLMELLLDYEVDDIKDTGNEFEVTVSPAHFIEVKNILENKKLTIISSLIDMIPQNTMKVEGSHAEGLLKLIDALEDNDDVQHVYSNFDISESELERIGTK